MYKTVVFARTEKRKIRVRHWYYYAIGFQIAIYYKSLSMGCMWPRLIWHYRSCINTNVSRRRDCCPVCRLSFDLFLESTWFIMEDAAYSHARHTPVGLLQNIECRNLSVW